MSSTRSRPLRPLPHPGALLLLLASSLGCGSAAGGDEAFRLEVEGFLERYNARWQQLSTTAAEAQWASKTRIVEGDDSNMRRTREAEEALAAFAGGVDTIALARAYKKRGRELPPLVVRQLDAVLQNAGASPQTVPELVERRIEVEARLQESLDGFRFRLDGAETTPNALDSILRDERDLERRRAAWESSKAVGAALKPDLVLARGLRNDVVRALGHKDFFAYMAAEYGMTTEQLAAKVDQLRRELRPLYIELHTWARHELAARHGQPVPDLIPAHWIPNRWSQDWSGLVDVPGFDLDSTLRQKEPRWIVEQAERFYISMGFEPLPQGFWERSSLWELPPDAPFKKNTHASAWHVDYERDVRCLMSVRPGAEWYETAHHELGHIHYYLAYSRPEVPPVLRNGANRAFHEAIGSLMGLAAMQPRFAEAVGLPLSGARPDPLQLLLKEALNYVVFIPWSAGTMFEFERELYAKELPAERWNQRWWELVALHQGVAPPTARGEEHCDAATKTHIVDDPAAYYDYALSFVLLFQLHDHIARNILKEDPRDTNYFGRRDAGEFLQGILARGATEDWRVLLRKSTGGDLSAKPMLEYFEPLKAWLARQNAGRKATLAPY